MNRACNIHEQKVYTNREISRAQLIFCNSKQVDGRLFVVISRKCFYQMTITQHVEARNFEEISLIETERREGLLYSDAIK